MSAINDSCQAHRSRSRTSSRRNDIKQTLKGLAMKRRSVVDRLRHVIWLSALLTHVSITFAVAQPHEILHHFQNPLYNPSGVVEDSDGSLYGTFDSGGPGNGGGLFRVAPDGTFTVVHAFKFQVSSDPRHPRGGLAKGPDGAFYGATLSGGTNGNGTLFRWDRTTLTILHSFI